MTTYRAFAEIWGLPMYSLIYAPLINYGGYHWYDLGNHVLIHDISLVICDGSPSSTQGGRYGLMPVMDKQLAEHCVVLFDDTHSKAEQRIIVVCVGISSGVSVRTLR